MKPTHALAGAALVAVLATGIALAQEWTPPLPRKPYDPLKPEQRERDTGVEIPAGTYTAFVFTNDAGGRGSVDVSLRTDRGEVRLAVPAGQTLVVPFEGGWRVDRDASVRADDDSLSVWGVTGAGPVPIAPKGP